MTIKDQTRYVVAVVGAGPAGLYAAKRLADAGVRVALFNRDIKPGGLAEYGIYHDKHKMKEGLRKQFRQILASPLINYYGNIRIGQQDDLSLDDLRDLGFQAILVTVGAQGTKWLGLPGEDLRGVYHAKDLVYHYNRLPPFSQRDFHIGRRAALIGVGNVMVDIAHWLIRDRQIDEVTAVARRGPAEVKFTRKEMENVIGNLDLQALEVEIARVAPVMRAVGQDPEAAKSFILSAQKKGLEPISDTRFRLRFLSSPSRILGDSEGSVSGLEIEDTTLVLRNGTTKAQRLGTTHLLDVDTVVFCIGDRVDASLGLPMQWNAFVKNPNPRFPLDGISYETFDPEANEPIEGVFVAGWAREASSGLVGVAHKDGTHGALAMMHYLQATHQPLASGDAENVLRAAEQHLERLGKPVVTTADWQRLEAVERSEAQARGLEAFKFATNEEMFAAMGLTRSANQAPATAA